MERFTISLSESLAKQFDELIHRKGYENRSEAVRDLVRRGPRLPRRTSSNALPVCVGVM